MSVLSLFNLRGKVAVVTGGSRGLGLSIAQTLGELGARVAIVARKKQELEQARAALADSDIHVETFVADLSNAEAVTPLVDDLITRFGTIDILVNNAATGWTQAAEDHSLEGWRKVMAVNVEGVFLLTQEIGRRVMIPNRTGKIINVASVGGLRANRPEQEAYTLAYSTSKGAMVNFTRALASEWGRYGITVNALCPGLFRSKMAAGLIDRIEDQLVAATPLRRLAEDQDFKGAAAFLCSDASLHMTGQMLIIDGGLTAC